MPKTSDPKVSIIILNWNGWQDTLECLGSLFQIIYPNFEIVIVDNGSSDDSVSRINEYLFKNKIQNSKFITLDSNLGFSGGNNVGIKYAVKNSADYVFLLNNDTVVEKKFLTELVKTAENNKDFGLIGPKIYFWPSTKPERIWFTGGKVNWLKTKGTHINYNAEDSQEEKKSFGLIKADYITGCGILIRKEVIQKIGVLSEDYFLYYEDTDYCVRAKKAGWECGIEPKSHIWHKVSRSTKELSLSYLYYHARNGLLMAKRNNGALMIPVLYLFSFYIILKQIIKFLFIPKKREWAKMTIIGIRDFYANKIGKFS